MFRFLRLLWKGEQQVIKKRVYSHRDKVDDLAKDNWVGDEYLKGLIKNTKNLKDVKAIRNYLNDSDKVSNLSPAMVNGLKSGLSRKEKNIKRDELLERLMDKKDELGIDVSDLF